MNLPAAMAGPDVRGLFGLFPPSSYLASSMPVPAAEVPDPYQGLLVHDQHMTVTVEAFHKEQVDVRVLETHRGESAYARKILLVTQKTHRVVQFGLVRIHLQFCSPEVRAEILAEQTPLGRILINHDVLRRIEPTAYLRVVPGPAMVQWFGLTQAKQTYGRLAMIHCDEKPAIELLEIVAPEDAASR
jgi:chorismate-pyruvate lyase